MKKCFFLVITAFIIWVFSVGVLAETTENKVSEPEIIFSETFEGDLSRWVYEDALEYIHLRDYSQNQEAETYKKEYIGQYFELSTAVTTTKTIEFERTFDWFFPSGTAIIPVEKTNKEEFSKRIISPKFNVEPKQTYTFAYDKLSADASLVEFVFFDAEGNEIKRDKISLAASTDKETLKKKKDDYLGHVGTEWFCAYKEITAPDSAFKAHVEIVSPVICDNIVILKGFKGFQPEIRNRIKVSPHATDKSDTIDQNPQLVFFDPLDKLLDDWEYTPTKYTLTSDSKNITFGKNSIKFKKENSDAPVGITFPAISAVPLGEYTLSVDLKAEIGREIYAYLKFCDKENRQIQLNSVKHDDPKWKECIITATAPKNAHTVYVKLVSPKGKEVAYADRLRLSLKTSENANALPSESSDEGDLSHKEEPNKFILTIGKTEADVFGEIKTNDVATLIKNGRTMLPARFVAENLGAKVIWNSDEPKKITVKNDTTEIVMEIDNSYAYVNGVMTELDSPLFIENERTFCPVRFICENLDATVEWNEETQQVLIIKKTSLPKGE